MEAVVRKPRAVIVDDETPARLRLRELLQCAPSVVLTAECASGAEAVAAIRDLSPDLLLLDVQMPLMDGFHVLRETPIHLMPVTIFVTAYDRYALAAFYAHALDYLLKPFSDERFAQALERAIAQIALRDRSELASRMLAMLGSRIEVPMPAPVPHGCERLPIKANNRLVVLNPAEIDWVEAAGVYVQIHAGQKVYLHRESIASIEARLGAARFVRIHRSTLVNLDRIRELSLGTRGESYVHLSNGTALRLSGGYRRALEEQLGRLLRRRARRDDLRRARRPVTPFVHALKRRALVRYWSGTAVRTHRTSCHRSAPGWSAVVKNRKNAKYLVPEVGIEPTRGVNPTGF